MLCLFPPPPCALGVSCRRRLFGALSVCSRSCVADPRSWAGRYNRQGRKAKDHRSRDSHSNRGYTRTQTETGSPSWSVPFGVSCCCLRCCTCSPYCVSLQQNCTLLLVCGGSCTCCVVCAVRRVLHSVLVDQLSLLKHDMALGCTVIACTTLCPQKKTQW